MRSLQYCALIALLTFLYMSVVWTACQNDSSSTPDPTHTSQTGQSGCLDESSSSSSSMDSNSTTTTSSSSSSSSSETTLECPIGMVLIDDTFCIDVYEASRTDATDASEGSAATVNDPPISGVIPWRVFNLTTAEQACTSVGKRMCSPSEWEQACAGPLETTYTYGDTYVIGNCSDLDSGWGVDPTGSYVNCTNGFQVFDMNGNMWELDSDGTPRGGAHNCNTGWRELHSCTCSYWDEGSSSWKDSCPVSCSSAYCGFRCCKD